MLNALAELNPTAFSTNFYQAPPTQQFDIPDYEPEHEQQQNEPQAQTQTHAQTPPHTPHHHQSYQFGGFAIYTPQYSFTDAGSSSQIQGSLPPMFATHPGTPWSAMAPQDCYRPTMPSQLIQDDNYGIVNDAEAEAYEEEQEQEQEEDQEDEEEEEEAPQFTRAGRGRTGPQPLPQVRRIQPQRTKKVPRCGTSSHRGRH